MRLANVEGTRALVRAARDARVKRFVHTSSVAAIGHVAGGIADEHTSWDFARLRIPYCDTKHAAEQVVRDEGVRQGLDAVIVNPAFVFGPGDRRKARGSWLQHIARRPPFFAPGGGMNAVDVHDVASGHILAAQHGRTGERYILGGENLTHAQLFRKVCRIIGKRPPRVTIPAPLMRMVARAATWLDPVFALRPPATAEILRMLPLKLFYSSEKAATELGYASFPIDMAIKATFDWMLDMDLLPAGVVRGLGRV
jgi:dihydroflavonol-4-reductase